MGIAHHVSCVATSHPFALGNRWAVPTLHELEIRPGLADEVAHCFRRIRVIGRAFAGAAAKTKRQYGPEQCDRQAQPWPMWNDSGYYRLHGCLSPFFHGERNQGRGWPMNCVTVFGVVVDDPGPPEILVGAALAGVNICLVFEKKFAVLLPIRLSNEG